MVIWSSKIAQNSQKNAKNSYLRNFSGHLTYGSNLFKKLIILRNFILSLKPKETGLNLFFHRVSYKKKMSVNSHTKKCYSQQSAKIESL